jgi:hypothetical protein
MPDFIVTVGAALCGRPICEPTEGLPYKIFTPLAILPLGEIKCSNKHCFLNVMVAMNEKNRSN